MEEAAADFVAGLRLGLHELLHHGQEVPVNSKNLLDVGEQNLRGRAGTLGWQGEMLIEATWCYQKYVFAKHPDDVRALHISAASH